MKTSLRELKSAVAESLQRAPIIAVVRHADRAVAASQARAFMRHGLEMIEVTFTVPGATDLVRELLDLRPGGSTIRIGMGTVTTAARARDAVAAGSEFLVTPNVSAAVAGIAHAEDLFLCMGGLSPSELVAAHELGADLLKVYPLPPVGGPAYLSVVRQPLGDLAPMLAGGGFGIEEIPAYRAAGAVAFGIGAPLLAPDEDATSRNIRHALALARGGP
ncbi:MAG: 2-dehydro-3-deoxyphosphogluconate aldolase / (4S)-4-hydroxy-2-oxoglutarate aldolase [Acidobacteriota bacterium]|nr:2-dehydro-3-deoxyphosphogluconate aldolase / (4S)-4-hydroxy-2-oxoglutarate aldolase [Acidobacteriota bacterium]